ncbi:MAG: hypothetical protein MI757_22815 [Pirellulales bacterium]|nr:hypothetical protein [Pirellulales bacterium]
MAGPWFTVHKSGDDWQELGRVWISNGEEDCIGRIEIRIEMEEIPDVLTSHERQSEATRS